MQKHLRGRDRLRELSRIIGTWRVSGEARGIATYEWFDQRYSIIQRVNLGETRGIEFIRYDDQTKALQSYYFDRSGSQVLTYRYSIKGDEFRIELDMPDRQGAFVATFSERDRVLDGRWDWVQDGKRMGYAATLTRVTRSRPNSKAKRSKARRGRKS